MSSHDSSCHQRFRYRLPAEQEDGFVAELWARGMLGAQVLDASAVDGVALAAPDAPSEARGPIALDAYFPSEAPPAAAEPGSGWHRAGVVLVAVETLDDEDWLAPWRAAARPFAVGRRFLLDPREPSEAPAPADDRIVLRLPARAAFGTGSHESTRLALELLEELPVAGRTVLDVGTGTGVLAFAALALGARSATGCDVDPVAVVHAHENRRLNRRALPVGSRLGLWAGGIAALAPAARFEAVLVNVLPEGILPERGGLAAAVAPGGALIYSGAVTEREAEVAAAFAECGLAVRRRAVAGEWVALLLEPETGRSVAGAAADPSRGGGRP